MGCASRKDLPPSVVQSIATSHSGTIVNPQTGRPLYFGAITKAPNGDIIVAGRAEEAPIGDVIILSSSDHGVTWVYRRSIIPTDVPIGMQTMVTVGSAVLLSIVSCIEATDGEIQSHIWRSDDSGITWTKVVRDTHYQWIFSRVLDSAGRVAVSLTYSPQAAGLGYKYAITDFGWFDLTTNTIEITSRLASVGDQPGNFPSEVFYYRRPSDNALVAAVRWGESPEIPYLKLKISTDEGLTWSQTNIVWQGYAGLANACVNSEGELWATGYLKVADYTSFTVVWQIDPETGLILGTYFPFSQFTGVQVGNGQVYCDQDSPNLFLATGNGPLTFAEVELD